MTEAFRTFLTSVDGCTAEEFHLGLRQAYYSLASLVGVLANSMQPLLGMSEEAKLRSAADEAVKLLGTEFQIERGLEGRASTDAQTTEPHAVTGTERLTTAIAATLPISQQLAETVIKAWVLQKESKANLHAIACPTDYVIGSELAVFARFDTRQVFLHTPSISSSVEVKHITKPVTKKVEPSVKSPGMDSGVSEKTPTAAATVATKGAVQNDPHIALEVNGVTLPSIPADARACAVLTMDVVVPPERFIQNFEWFYRRTTGCDNDYERVAAARIFASRSSRAVVVFLDFLIRMVTGKPMEFLFSKAVGQMMGIPNDVSKTPPALRKLVCVYMNASYQWVLMDMVPDTGVISHELPKQA